MYKAVARTGAARVAEGTRDDTPLDAAWLTRRDRRTLPSIPPTPVQMRIPVLPRALLRVALLVLPLGLLPAPATAQLTCTSRTDCVEKGIPYTNQDPGMSFRSLSDTVYEARQEVVVFTYDAWGLDEYSRRFTISGGTLLIGPTWRWNKPVTSGYITAIVQLAPGPNVLTAKVCDLTDRCTEQSREVVYQMPPPAPGRVAPVVRNALDPGRRAAATCDGCSDAVLAYSTPTYVSLDQPRGVTLMYARSQAAPHGYAELEVTEISPEAPVRMSIQVMHPAGNAVTPEIFYEGGGGARTMAVQWDASSYGTSALVHGGRTKLLERGAAAAGDGARQGHRRR